ncbi:MAG: YnbE family lipoprotein [Gammaproteobacteria bacterium]|nr:YnbE family lipoprotein [Gammaproteobacteria bacterium]MDH5653805.1 YnbE family lipoprotein [Gammaproteobacteria bacterium]
MRNILLRFGILFGILLHITACTPTVAVMTPTQPITINLNVKIEHEVRVKVDKDLETAFDNNSGLF